MQTHEVKHLLRIRYAAPAWAMLFEVPDGTGGHKNRSADAVAMSLFPSRGLELHGFEVKVSRSDWQKELKDPSKAEAVCRYCDRWWIVAGDKSIVQDDELPPTWGLLVVQGGKLVSKVKAPKLPAQPVGRPFLAALLRRVEEQGVDKETLRQAKHAGYVEGERIGEQRAGGWQGKFMQLAEKLDAFEKASGIPLNQWPLSAKSGTEIGETVKKVLQGYYSTPQCKLKSIVEHLERTANQLKKELEPEPVESPQ